MRKKFIVTFQLSDGSNLLRTCYAESPEHAVKKISKAVEQQLKYSGLTIKESWASTEK
jgi:hypothetical protein